MVFGTTSKAAASKWSTKNRITTSGPPTVVSPHAHVFGVHSAPSSSASSRSTRGHSHSPHWTLPCAGAERSAGHVTTTLNTVDRPRRAEAADPGVGETRRGEAARRPCPHASADRASDDRSTVNRTLGLCRARTNSLKSAPRGGRCTLAPCSCTPTLGSRSPSGKAER